jgi:hypothetical protein
MPLEAHAREVPDTHAKSGSHFDLSQLTRPLPHPHKVRQPTLDPRCNRSSIPEASSAPTPQRSRTAAPAGAVDSANGAAMLKVRPRQSAG